ncbi:MAG TPA: hypothetical protein VFU98_18570 [Microlunatus sp.]|nr:hypothetical protein [Microlunatus sp.]
MPAREWIEYAEEVSFRVMPAPLGCGWAADPVLRFDRGILGDFGFKAMTLAVLVLAWVPGGSLKPNVTGRTRTEFR